MLQSLQIADCFSTSFDGSGAGLYCSKSAENDCIPPAVPILKMEAGLVSAGNVHFIHLSENEAFISGLCCIGETNLVNSVICGADDFNPGFNIGLLLAGTKASVRHCTIVNHSQLAVGVFETQAQSQNSIIWNNGETWDSPGGVCNMSFSCIDDLTDGDGMVYDNPLFADFSQRDFRLLPGSPCIDAPMGDIPQQTTCGNPRYDDANTANTGIGTPALPTREPLNGKATRTWDRSFHLGYD